MSWKNVNEARETDGRAPLGDPDDKGNIFNHILVQTPKGMLDLTTETYVGEEQLAKVAADTQITVAEAQAEVDAANTEAAALAAAQPEPTGGAPK